MGVHPAKTRQEEEHMRCLLSSTQSTTTCDDRHSAYPTHNCFCSLYVLIVFFFFFAAVQARGMSTIFSTSSHNAPRLRLTGRTCVLCTSSHTKVCTNLGGAACCPPHLRSHPSPSFILPLAFLSLSSPSSLPPPSFFSMPMPVRCTARLLRWHPGLGVGGQRAQRWYL